jgi:hypothetical protein
MTLRTAGARGERRGGDAPKKAAIFWPGRPRRHIDLTFELRNDGPRFMLYEEFGALLRYLRLGAGLSQEALARRRRRAEHAGQYRRLYHAGLAAPSGLAAIRPLCLAWR